MKKKQHLNLTITGDYVTLVVEEEMLPEPQEHGDEQNGEE